MARTKEEWFVIIQKDLGSNSAFVPLDEPDLDTAMSSAMDVWQQYLPVYESRSVAIPSGLLVIDFSSETDLQGVGGFRYTDSTVDISRTMTPFYPIQVMARSLQGPRFVFEMNFTIERWARLLGGKEDTFWDSETRKLFVWNPRGMANVTFELMKEVSITSIQPHRYNLFRKLFRSQARDQMIQIFERLGPLPGPEGEIRTDMEYHKKMAEKEMEEVINVMELMPEAMVAPRWD